MYVVSVDFCQIAWGSHFLYFLTEILVNMVFDLSIGRHVSFNEV